MTEQPAPIPFVPISRQLLDSSVWETDLRVRVLWITMLMTAAEPARRGTVDMTIRALSGRAAMSPEDVRYALDVLESPDHNSRTPGNDGRRIQRIDAHREWGWRILNWQEYEQARERLLNAARAARYRDRQAGMDDDQSNAPSRPVTLRHGAVTPNHLEVEVEVEDEVEGEKRGAFAPLPPPAPSRRTRFVPPTENEWVAYASATWPTWVEDDVRGAWASYEGRGWKGYENWKGCAKTCYHRWAGRGATPSKVRQAALVGSHHDTRPVRDISTAPPEIRETARKWVKKEPTTEAEDEAYIAWMEGRRDD